MYQTVWSCRLRFREGQVTASQQLDNKEGCGRINSGSRTGGSGALRAGSMTGARQCAGLLLLVVLSSGLVSGSTVDAAMHNMPPPSSHPPLHTHKHHAHTGTSIHTANEKYICITALADPLG